MKTQNTLLKVAVMTACAGFAGTVSAAYTVSFDQNSAFVFDAATPAPGTGDFGINGVVSNRVSGVESIWWPADSGVRGTPSVDSPIDTTDLENPDDPAVFAKNTPNGNPVNQGAVSALKVVALFGDLLVPEDGSFSDALALSYVYHRNNAITGDSPIAGAFTDSTKLTYDGFEVVDANLLPWFFNETPNDGDCEDGAPNATNCDDVFQLPLGSFDPVPLTIGGINFEFVFNIVPGDNAITNLEGCRANVNNCTIRQIEGQDVPFFSVWTGEGSVNFLKTTIAARVVPPRVVPEPGVLSLMGLGLAGLGLSLRRRRKAVS